MKRVFIYSVLFGLLVIGIIYVVVWKQVPTGLSRGRIRSAIEEVGSRIEQGRQIGFSEDIEIPTASARHRRTIPITQMLSDLLGVDMDGAISNALEEIYRESREGEANPYTAEEIPVPAEEGYFERRRDIENVIGDRSFEDYEISVGSGSPTGPDRLGLILDEILTSPSRFPYIPPDLQVTSRPRRRGTIVFDRDESNRPRVPEMEMASGSVVRNPGETYWAPYIYNYWTPGITSEDLIYEYNMVCRQRYTNLDGAGFDLAQIGNRELIMTFMYTIMPEDLPINDYFCTDTFILMIPDYVCWSDPRVRSLQEIRSFLNNNGWRIDSMSTDSFSAEEIWDFFVTGYIKYDVIRESDVYFPPRGGLKRGIVRRFSINLGVKRLVLGFRFVDVYYRIDPNRGYFADAMRRIDGSRADLDGVRNGEISFATFLTLDNVVLFAGTREIGNYQVTRTCELRNIFVPALTFVLPNDKAIDSGYPCTCDSLIRWYFDYEHRRNHPNYGDYPFFCWDHDFDVCGY